ncbi:hypothetical protein CBS101457_002911 [Exobasidium rhododendri]|nr:hypothetical protein CBS101457_002911 [Exobasidium rhododendri]
MRTGFLLIAVVASLAFCSLAEASATSVGVEAPMAAGEDMETGLQRRYLGGQQNYRPGSSNSTRNNHRDSDRLSDNLGALNVNPHDDRNYRAGPSRSSSSGGDSHSSGDDVSSAARHATLSPPTVTINRMDSIRLGNDLRVDDHYFRTPRNSPASPSTSFLLDSGEDTEDALSQVRSRASRLTVSSRQERRRQSSSVRRGRIALRRGALAAPDVHKHSDGTVDVAFEGQDEGQHANGTHNHTLNYPYTTSEDDSSS